MSNLTTFLEPVVNTPFSESYCKPKSPAIVWGVISFPYLLTSSCKSTALVEAQGEYIALEPAPPDWLYLCKR